MKKNVVIGILAHVDAGKTTLSEAMLYLSGKIKKLGRVDHRDSYLDTHSIERSRGITIFSKQAVIDLPQSSVTLLDTPGHVDFVSETERSLRVLDYAVLVISGTDGVQAHTETLWQLLRRYGIPTFIFVTKMDLPVCDRAALMADLQRRLDAECVDFGENAAALNERLAMCGEAAMDEYLSRGELSRDTVAELIKTRRVFPCFFGSGLRTDGVEEFMQAIDEYAIPTEAGDVFSARVYKIARDAQGKRLSFLRVNGGELSVRQLIRYAGEDGAEHEEKISQLRIYSGIKYEAVDTVKPGRICAALGLSETFPGQGLGAEADVSAEPVLEPVLSYSLLLPPTEDPRVMLPKLMQLQEEDPQLHIRWDERGRAIRVELMGKVQAEVFRALVKERFDVDVALDAGRIMYKETIADTVEGVGHFEPLRHYAEVHLIMEPMPRGSGIVVDSICPEDGLDRNWQRLILGHVLEKQHLGVLTGSPLTDVKMTLAAGRAHLKHTEGGDFRQATYRAIRQGLMQAKSVLLEPWYAFSIELPPELIGRAISDVRQMSGSFTGPDDAGGMLRIEGSAPVSEMNGYASEVAAYSGGRGKFSCRVEGYRPCHNEKDVIVEMGYDAESDVENTADSVFCAHGGGFNVRWDKVPEYMHLESCLKKQETPAPVRRYRSLSIDERELEAIMEREFGPIKRPEYRAPAVNSAPARPIVPPKKQYIIVDGYNIIFASQELSALAREKLGLARGRLMDMLSNYCGFTKRELVLVFDGFRTPGNPGSREEYHNIHVAFTKDGETADAYIERIADNIGKNYDVRVVTNDNLIRLSALRSGVLRTSSDEFALEVRDVLEQIDALLKKTNYGAHKYRLELDRTENGEK